MNPLWKMINENDAQEVSCELMKEVLSKFNEIILKASTRDQRKQLIHILLNEITIREDRKIDKIKIKLNKDLLEYLNIEELSEDGSFSALYIRI